MSSNCRKTLSSRMIVLQYLTSQTFMLILLVLLFVSNNALAQADDDQDRYKRGVERKNYDEKEHAENRSKSIVVAPEYPRYEPPYNPPVRYRPFDVRVWTDSSSYLPGDRIRISFRSSKDAYVYLFDTDTQGVTRQIFPNYYDQDNFVRAGRTYSIPDRGYSLLIDGPRGREHLDITAVRERWGSLRSYGQFRKNDPYPRRHGGYKELQRKVQDESAHRYRNQSKEFNKGEVRRGYNQRNRIEVQPVPYPPVRRTEVAYNSTSFLVRNGYGHHYQEDYGPGPYQCQSDGYFYPYGYYGDTQKVKIKTSPSGANIFIDGQYVGRSSIKIKLPLGRHEIRIEKYGYYAETRSVYFNREHKHRQNYKFHLRRAHRY